MKKKSRKKIKIKKKRGKKKRSYPHVFSSPPFVMGDMIARLSLNPFRLLLLDKGIHTFVTLTAETFSATQYPHAHTPVSDIPNAPRRGLKGSREAVRDCRDFPSGLERDIATGSIREASNSFRLSTYKSILYLLQLST